MPKADVSMKDKRKRLAASLRRLRIESGYTQYHIAEILDANRSTYAYYELGKTLPDVFTLSTLCKLYGITINELLDMDNGIARTRRAPHKAQDQPEKIGHLTYPEKAFIALARLYPEILEELKVKFYLAKDPDE